MATRYDVLSVRKYKAQDGTEKSAWTNIGVAFEQRDGKGFSLSLHCMPAPDPEKGEYRLVMRIPQPRENDPGAERRAKHSEPLPPRQEDDDIPF